MKILYFMRKENNRYNNIFFKNLLNIFSVSASVQVFSTIALKTTTTATTTTTSTKTTLLSANNNTKFKINQRHLLKKNHYNKLINLNKMDNTKDNVYIKLKEKLMGLRKWQTINTINTDDKNTIGQKFKLCSYNILAQDLVDKHLELYQFHDKAHLNWQYRSKQLISEIIEMKADILCLQEVQQDHLNVLVSGLKSLNYELLYKKRTSDEFTDGCALFYNRNLFKLVQYKFVQFYQRSVPMLNRNNIAIIAKFELNNYPNNYIIIATTHLLYNPRRQDLRLAQIQILLAELDRISSISLPNNPNHCSIDDTATNLHNNVPIILTGDFNLMPYSAPYNLMTTGYLDLQNLMPLNLNTAPPSSAPCNNYRFPIALGITDNCQHYNVVMRNLRNETLLDHPKIKSMQHTMVEMENSNLPFNTGILTHNLKLSSITNNFQSTGTTYQDTWIVVDFIFYSKPDDLDGTNSDTNTTENKNRLILLSHLNYPTFQQLNVIGLIPNSIFGSDHFPLAAEFFLNIKN